MHYVIEGIPQQAERPRAKAIKKYIGNKVKYTATVYDPPKSKQAKARIKTYLLGLHTEAPLTEDVKATFIFYVPIPKSYTKKQRKQIEEGTLRPSKKPDVSNYIKLIEDACNGILYHDDSQIVHLEAWKEYSAFPRTEIYLEKI